MVLAAARREEMSLGEWVRTEIKKDLKHSLLDDFADFQWIDPLEAEMPPIAVTYKMITAIDDRLEYLYEHPNRRGWYPASMAQYIRAICEHGVNVSGRYRLPVWGKPQVDLIVRNS
jgi:hypothetical protein